MKINWSYFIHEPIGSEEMVMFEPENALAVISKQCEQEPMKCPAVRDFFRNAYIVRCPIDISFTIKDCKIVSTNIPEGIRHHIHFRSEPNETGYILFSIFFRYVFWSKESVIMEQMPPLMTGATFDVVCGEYDFGKWVRPVEAAISFTMTNGEFKIKRGQPIFMVRFRTEQKVCLSFSEKSKAVEDAQCGCSNLKHIIKGLSLPECYKLGEKLIKRIWK